MVGGNEYVELPCLICVWGEDNGRWGGFGAIQQWNRCAYTLIDHNFLVYCTNIITTINYTCMYVCMYERIFAQKWHVNKLSQNLVHLQWMNLPKSPSTPNADLTDVVLYVYRCVS